MDLGFNVTQIEFGQSSYMNSIQLNLVVSGFLGVEYENF